MCFIPKQVIVWGQQQYFSATGAGWDAINTINKHNNMSQQVIAVLWDSK